MYIIPSVTLVIIFYNRKKKSRNIVHVRFKLRLSLLSTRKSPNTISFSVDDDGQSERSLDYVSGSQTQGTVLVPTSVLRAQCTGTFTIGRDHNMYFQDSISFI